MKKIKKNDEVIVISGKHKGQFGRIISINKKNDTVKIDKINILKKHNKPTQKNPDGGILEFEGPIHISNIALKSKKNKKEIKSTKVSIKIDEKGKKNRIDKSTGKEI